MKKLSIIVVEYKSGKALESLLSELPKRKDWEVIVVDNTKDNRGYGGGCNAGAAKAKGEYLLFLNPDVLLQERAILALVKHLDEHPRVGVVGPQFLNSAGKIEQSSTQFPTPARAMVALSFLDKVFPNNPISQAYWMRSWKRTTTKTVDVISGAAMLVRERDFKTIGGFDEQFFLYWEEFDLCKRLKAMGKSAVFLAEAQAKHPREMSMKNAKIDIDEQFHRSRWRFFRKHFGFARALLVESWLTAGEQWRLLVLGVLTAYLRLADLTHIALIGDVGRDYLQAFRMLNFQALPLLGIPSSIPRFSQGPFNIWFDTLAFSLGGVSIFTPPLFAAVLSVLAVGLFYILLSKHATKSLALALALLYAASPAAVLQSRMPFYLFAVPAFTMFFIIGLQARPPSIFRSVLLFWLLFQWELATLPLVALIPAMLVIRRIPCKHVWKQLGAATVLGLLPQIISDVTHQCAQLCGLGAWTIYRLIAPLGVTAEHAMTGEKLAQVFQGSASHLERLFGISGGLVLAAAAGMIVSITLRLVLKKENNPLAVYALVGTLFLSVGIVLHGSPSEAYFPPFLVLLPILAAFCVKPFPRVIQRTVTFALLVLALNNAVLLTTHRFFQPSILNTIEAAKWIVADARGKPITLKSFDAPANFATYLDGYRFLIITNGGALQDQGGAQYVIAQDPKAQLPTINVEKRIFGNVAVVK